MAGHVPLVGYACLAGWALYVKLKTCDETTTVHDASWYCNVDGKTVVVLFVAIPVLAVVCGLIVGSVQWLAPKLRRYFR